MPGPVPTIIRLLEFVEKRGFLGRRKLVSANPPVPGEAFFRFGPDHKPRPVSRHRLVAAASKGDDIFAWPSAGIPIAWQAAVGDDGKDTWILRIAGRLRVCELDAFAPVFAPLAAQYRSIGVSFLHEMMGQSVEIWIKACVAGIQNLPEFANGNQIDPGLWRFRFGAARQELPFEQKGLEYVPHHVECRPASQFAADAPIGRRILSRCADKHGENPGAVRIEKSFAHRGAPIGPLALSAPALRKGDSLGFTLASERTGVVTLLNVDPAGSLIPLLPSESVPAPAIAAGKRIPVGERRSPWISDLREEDATGRDALLAIVSDHPLLPGPAGSGDGILAGNDAEDLLARLETLPGDSWSADTLEFDIV